MTYSLHKLVEISPLPSEEVTAVAAYKNNIYMGTNKGRILHYHQFSGLYTLISTFDHNASPVRKILIMGEIERALILSGHTVTVHTLPELSPCHVGRMRDVNDISMLSRTSSKTIANKVVIFTSSMIRIIQINEGNAKVLKETNYADAICGVSTHSTNPHTNYSNLVLVANRRSYDVVDMKLNRKIPLFEYCSAHDVKPFVVPYSVGTEQEYLLTIEHSTTLAMLVNAMGDVIRGTLMWDAYPDGIAIEFPHVLAVFGNNLMVSSLEEMCSIQEINLENYGSDLVKVRGQTSASEGATDTENLLGNTTIKDNENNNKHSEPSVDVDFERSSESGKESSHKKMHGAQQEKFGEDGNRKHHGKVGENDTESEKYSDEIAGETVQAEGITENSKVTEVADSETKPIVNPDNDGTNTEASATTGGHDENEEEHTTDTAMDTQKDDILSESKITHTTRGGVSSTVDATTHEKSADDILYEKQTKKSNSDTQYISLCSVNTISYTHHLDALTLVNIDGTELPCTEEITSESSVLLYNRRTIWAVGKNPITGFLTKITHQTLEELDIEELRTFVDTSTGAAHTALVHVLVIKLLAQSMYEEALQYLLRFKNGALVVDPLFVLYLCGRPRKSAVYKCVLIFAKGLEIDRSFQERYIEQISDIVENDSVRIARYELGDVASILRTDSNWATWSDTNRYIASTLEPLHLLKAYSMAVGSERSLAEPFCDLAISFLSSTRLNEVDLTRERLLELIIGTLPSLEPSVYSRILLGVFENDCQAGFEFLKKQKSNNTAGRSSDVETDACKSDRAEILENINRRIIASVTHSGNYALLKIEYLENAPHIDYLELYSELLNVLTTPDNFSEADMANFSVLEATFPLDNSASNLSWPKLTWVDYVHSRLSTLAETEYATVYLKVYELGLCFPEVKRVCSGYFAVFEAHDPIAFLLEKGDMAAAEYMAKYGVLPAPSCPFYGKQECPPTSKDAKEKLRRMFDHYLTFPEVERTNAVVHFVETYRDVFSATELLDMIPDNFPLVYLREFLGNVLAELNGGIRGSLVKKGLSKSYAEIVGKVWKDLSSG